MSATPATTPVLLAASHLIGAECAAQNKQFLLCKK